MLIQWTRSAAIFVIVAMTSPSFGQAPEPLPRLGVGAKFSSLGIGFEAATAVTSRSNVRGGFNFFDYDRGFSHDGIDYDATVRLRSVEVHYDWFFGHGLRASPGLLVYNDNRVEGLAGVPGGRQFTLGSTNYVSSPSNPVRGTAQMDFSKNRVSP